MLLLARLGLRAGEVAHLGLGDIDWRHGEVAIVGKGDRAERLPLPADVGAAIAAYLRRGRPGTAEGRSVFVRVHAPHRALTTGGVTMVVFDAAQRAGLPRCTRTGCGIPQRPRCCAPAARCPRSVRCCGTARR
jgi:site-specific recombinase XerD